MTRKFDFLCGAALFSISVISATAAPSCDLIPSQIEGVFSDIHNKISNEDQEKISLLKTCAAEYARCVIVEAPAPKWFEIIKGNKMQDFSEKAIGNRHALVALTSVPIHHDRSRCALARFGGGTASVWTIDAWEFADGHHRTLDTDRIYLRGEFKSPSELIRESEKVVRSLK